MSGSSCSFGQFRGREIEGYLNMWSNWSKNPSPFLCIFFLECLRHCIMEASLSFINFDDCFIS